MSRRPVHGRCDPERKLIEIVVQHANPEKRDKHKIHEICHATVDGKAPRKKRQRQRMLWDRTALPNYIDRRLATRQPGKKERLHQRLDRREGFRDGNRKA